jgi:hypothetical protein
MLINSGLEEEQEQWDWLEQTLQNHAGSLSLDQGRARAL